MASEYLFDILKRSLEMFVHIDCTYTKIDIIKQQFYLQVSIIWQIKIIEVNCSLVIY